MAATSGARRLVLRRRLKAAAEACRKATRTLAEFEAIDDADVYGAITVTHPDDLDAATELIASALGEEGPIEVVVIPAQSTGPEAIGGTHARPESHRESEGASRRRAHDRA